MASELSDALESLSKSAQLLNQLTDEATATVLKVEEFLGDFNLGIEGKVAFGGRREPSKIVNSLGINTHTLALREIVHEYPQLEYRRFGKDRRFRIVVSDHFDNMSAWSELPRDIKLQAISALPALIRFIATEVEERIAKAKSALAEVSRILPSEIEV